MNKIYDSVCAWNAARYDQVYNKDLAIALLKEEYEEFLVAETEVDQLDALCDICYVAMGVLWKVNAVASVNAVSYEHSISLLTKLVDMNEVNPIYFVSTFLAVYEHAQYPVVQMMYNILSAAQTQINGMGINNVEAMRVVCDSNDSKTAKKTDPSIKANIDKGTGFIPPEPRLQALLDARHA